MDKMKRFIEVVVHNSTCNMKCHYCYLAQQGVSTQQKPCWNYTPEYMAKCLSPERLGGACIFNMCCDGETMLDKTTMQVVKLLAEQGHRVNIVTNGTITPSFKEIVSWGKNICENITILFSYHYLELKRLKLLDVFFDNAKLVKQAGCSFTIMTVFCDEYWDVIDELNEACQNALGALPHFMPYRKGNLDFLSRYTDEEYLKNGRSLKSDLFDVHVDEYHKPVKEFCYAGEWFMCLDLVSGDIKACYNQPTFDNVYKDINAKINFAPIGNNCKISYCYNSHSRIGLGVVPERDVHYLYADALNRVCKDGTEWVTEKSKEFYNTKLYNNNCPLDKKGQNKANLDYIVKYEINRLSKLHPLRIKNKIKKILGIKNV